LIGGVGTSCGGYVADRLSQGSPSHKLRAPARYAFGAFILLATAFLLPFGGAQFPLIALGALGSTASPFRVLVALALRPFRALEVLIWFGPGI
jgi:hypothetical protein